MHSVGLWPRAAFAGNAGLRDGAAAAAAAIIRCFGECQRRSPQP